MGWNWTDPHHFGMDPWHFGTVRHKVKGKRAGERAKAGDERRRATSGKLIMGPSQSVMVMMRVTRQTLGSQDFPENPQKTLFEGFSKFPGAAEAFFRVF